MKTNGLWALLAAASLLWGCGPEIKGLEKGETAIAVGVRDGDTLELDNGLLVHLAGVEAPRPSEPRAKEARAALERLVVKRSVQLAYGGQKRVRDAAVAHVFARTEGGRWIWVQQAMLLSGDARVHTRRENVSRVKEMLSAEASARKTRQGLWALPEFAVRRASDISRSDAQIAEDPACAEELAARKAPPTATPVAATAKDGADSAGEPAQQQRPRRKREFKLVEGRISSVAARERAVFLNFGDEIDRDFAVLIPKDAAAAWPGGVPTLESLKGRSVRVRGDLPVCARPLMRLDHDAQMELLEPPPARAG